MFSIEEFKEKWNNDNRIVKNIWFYNGDIVYADEYSLTDDDIPFIELFLDDILIGIFNVSNIMTIAGF